MAKKLIGIFLHFIMNIHKPNMVKLEVFSSSFGGLQPLDSSEGSFGPKGDLTDEWMNRQMDIWFRESQIWLENSSCKVKINIVIII